MDGLVICAAVTVALGRERLDTAANGGIWCCGRLPGEIVSWVIPLWGWSHLPVAVATRLRRALSQNQLTRVT
jgi:hypothetical protein